MDGVDYASKGDGGTTLSGIPITPEVIEATRLQPAAQPEQPEQPESLPIRESFGFRLGRRFGGWLFGLPSLAPRRRPQVG